MTLIRFLIILLLGFIFLHACVRILGGCKSITAGEYTTKQARLTGFIQHKGYTDVYFALRSNCWCDTIYIRYQWEKGTDLSRYHQNDRYTITYNYGNPISFKRNQ
jgi:hypothetical protein